MRMILLYIKNFLKSDFLKLLPYIIIASLLCMVYFSINTVISQRKQIDTYAQNIKAYDSQLSGLRNDNMMFRFTRDQLLTLNDSLVSKMLDKSKELGIKQSRITQLQYMKSRVIKKDSLIMLRDTIFKDNSVHIDTVIGDKWCQTRLTLDYPSSIKIENRVSSEKFLFITSKRETVSPPKKFFLLRWFQKKHTVLEIKVTDSNPYIINGEQKFIEVIKQ